MKRDKPVSSMHQKQERLATTWSAFSSPPAQLVHGASVRQPLPSPRQLSMFRPAGPFHLGPSTQLLESCECRADNTLQAMTNRTHLREALAAAIVSAEEARAPDRMLDLLRGAFRSLDSAQFVDDDMIRWAEAGLGAWRRWCASESGSHRIIVVDDSGRVSSAIQAITAALELGSVRIAASHTSALEALATYQPTAIVFDRDGGALAPSVEMLEWLATDLPHVRRIAFTQDEAAVPIRERSQYHVVLSKPPARDTFIAAVGPSLLLRPPG
jgi:hypothetical protein